MRRGAGGAMLLWGCLQFGAAWGASLGQYQTKLVGAGGDNTVEASFQGQGVALSADGTTAIVGGSYDNTEIGAAWVYTRAGNIWSQQGPKLVGSGVSGNPAQGRSVALSADGNTALIGGPQDDSSTGAVWVFTRSAGAWTQQGLKLVGTGAIGGSKQGYSVALSADGNTAIVGGNQDAAGTGAVWIFTRTNGTWTQQGTKLVGSDVSGAASLGTSVALSADGNTALTGGVTDNAAVGASWVFVRSAGVWTQQGPKLVGAGVAAGNRYEGGAVALSADGNFAVVGGSGDASNTGAVWTYARSGLVWSQQGAKTTGSGEVGAGELGVSIGLSADGSAMIVGGYQDDSNAGAAWVFARVAGAWQQQGAKLVGTLALAPAWQGYSVGMAADGNSAIVGGPLESANGAAWVYSGPSCTLDIDGNKSVDALTDGLMILRAMFGLTGTSVTANAVGANATRTTWQQLQPWLNGNCGTGFAP